MKISVPADSQVVVNLPSVDWIYLYRAAGVINLEATDAVGENRKTASIRQGQTIEYPGVTRLLISSNAGAQEIELQTGFGRFQPSVEAITSTVISAITDPVTVSQIVNAVTVEGTVSVDNHPTSFEISNLPEQAARPSGSLVVSDVAIPAGGSVVVPARTDRKALLLQNDSDTLTKCRVSDSGAVAAAGAYLIGGGGLLGELQFTTAAAVKIWNTSADDAVVTVTEEVY